MTINRLLRLLVWPLVGVLCGEVFWFGYELLSDPLYEDLGWAGWSILLVLMTPLIMIVLAMLWDFWFDKGHAITRIAALIAAPVSAAPTLKRRQAALRNDSSWRFWPGRVSRR